MCIFITMGGLNSYQIYTLGDQAAVLDLGNNISEALNSKVLAMQEWLRQHPFTGLKDLVAAYSSLTVLYDPFIINKQHHLRSTAFEFVKARLEEAWPLAEPANNAPARVVSIPVCYDPKFGYDLEAVAAAKGISIEELIHIHSSAVYRVYMLGFLPGFAYMGKLDERLETPRKTVPREQVAAGSVGIAGKQTGIYPLPSPGGWHVIGRTPLKLFDPVHEPPALLKAGDEVRFYHISLEAYNQLCQ
jgi:inhibitor of KinA